MRLNRDKLNKLAHTVADTLAETDQVGFLEDRNTIRQEARKILEKAWAINPHPDIAESYANLRLGDSARERLTRSSSRTRNVRSS